MKKRLSALILSALLGLTCLGGLTACDGFGVKVKKISTLDELKEYYNDENYSLRLMCDIDGNNETVEPFKAGKKFDGQGYTIKNLTVKEDSGGWYASLFDCQVSEICDLNLENISVEGSGVSDAVVLAASKWDSGSSVECKIDNVHIKNCAVTSEQAIAKGTYSVYVGGIYGGGSYDSYNGNTENDPDNCTITNCTVEDTQIKLTEYKGSKQNYTDTFTGGIAGFCKNISDCKVKNSSVYAESSQPENVPYVGGIVGSTTGDVENCASVGNELSIKGKYFVEGMLNRDSTSTVYIGGVAGRASLIRADGEEQSSGGTVSYSYADGNTINAYSSGDIFCGGFAGYLYGTTVERCYARSNEMVMDGCKLGNKDDSVKRRCGGFVGAVGINTIKSCFAYNDKNLFEYTFPDIAKSSKIAGFAASINKSAVITNCASFVAAEGLNAPVMDEFCPNKVEGITSCGVTSDEFGNVCGCEVLDELFWESPNALKTKLDLTSGPWKFDKGVPYLDI